MTVPPIEFSSLRRSELPVAVVTGGAGFVGSHLCERLLDDGFRVICVDNLQTGRMGNILHLVGNARFVFRQHGLSPTGCRIGASPTIS